MSLIATLHLIAGLGALSMGGGILLSEPARTRNRAFAYLCGALAIWNLGTVGHLRASQEDLWAWRMAFLLGSCLAGPLALHFVVVLSGAGPRLRRLLLVPAWVLTTLLWLSASSPMYGTRGQWPFIAMAVLGAILLTALAMLGRHAYALRPGPDRRAHLLLFWAAVVAVVGGVSDFVPRDRVDFFKLGPVTLLLFLLVVCSVIVRHRFLDVDVFLTRAVALIAGSAVVALIFRTVVRYTSGRFLLLFATSLLVLAALSPIGRLILSRAQSLLRSTDPVAQALLEISARLPAAKETGDLWRIVEEGRQQLPSGVRLDVFLRRPGQSRFHLTFRQGSAENVAAGSPLPAENPLPRLLAGERLPVTRRYLERERRDGALQQMEALDLQLIAPLFSGDRLRGWTGLGGKLPERLLTAEVATAFLAVSHQAASELERFETLEIAKRQAALATVGELAAGLAHEVRNPVAAIRGAAQAMGPAATPDQRGEMLEVIEEETERLGRVVGEFLDYANPGMPRRESVDLAELIRRVLKSQELAGRSLEARLHSDSEAPRALGDPDQLYRVFENLVRNASEAAGDGCRLNVEIHAENRNRVAIRLDDNGPGIPPDQMHRLFQPFFTTRSGGTGLGLALIHRIVEAHGGEVHVDGRPGLGAVFTVILPAATAPR